MFDEFDEFDEGTAIMPASDTPPVGERPFLAYEGLPSDHYLWLSGRIGAMFRGEMPASARSLPERED